MEPSTPLTDHYSELQSSISDIVLARSPRARTLRRMLRRYERNDSDVEDIIQDMAVLALTSPEKFGGKSSAHTWLIGVALNVARHHVARRAREAARTTSLDALQEIHPEDDSPADGAARAQCPSQMARQREMLQMVERELSLLTEDLRQTFDLACLQEHSYEDVAQALNIPTGTVRSRVARVRETLRQSIQDPAKPC
jgi:RNA polymerase sigma factor (sigma-70 family)